MKRQFEQTVERRSQRKVSTEDRQAFLLLATSLLGRAGTDAGGAAGVEAEADAGSGSATGSATSFDDQVRSAITSASKGAEAIGLAQLASAIRDHDVRITIDELSSFARAARVFEVHEDSWTFLGSCVDR